MSALPATSTAIAVAIQLMLSTSVPSLAQSHVSSQPLSRRFRDEGREFRLDEAVGFKGTAQHT